MNVLEVKIPYTNKFSETIPWYRFAESSLMQTRTVTTSTTDDTSWFSEINIAVNEARWTIGDIEDNLSEFWQPEKTIKLTAMLLLYTDMPISPRRPISPRKFVGKSIRPFAARTSQIKAKMINEAKHFALEKFFEHAYRFYYISRNISVDKLYRPLNDYRPESHNETDEEDEDSTADESSVILISDD